MTDPQPWQSPSGDSAADAAASPFGPPVVPPVAPPPAAPVIPPVAPPVPQNAPPQFGPPAPQYAPPQYGAPQYGQPQYGQPQYGQPQYGQPAAQPGAWTPPPKPGLIPLRPLTLGNILGASFQVLRRNPGPTFGFSLLVTGILYVVSLLVVGAVSFFAFGRIANATAADRDTVSAGSVGIIILSALVPAALSIVGSALLQGIISLEVARGTVAEKLKLRGLWRAAQGRLGALIGWSALIAVIALLFVGLIAGIIALLVSFGGTAGIVIGVLLGILGGLGAVVLAVWLSTRLALVPSAIVLERLPIRNALRRSWSLTTGYFWRTFGIILLVAVILGAVSQVVSTPLGLISGLAVNLLNPNGDPTAAIPMLAIVYGLTILITVVVGAITAVVQAATSALIYIDLRMRKEGLDLELSRFVEARQAGQPVEDPYLARPSTATTPPAATPW